ncbi:MAG: DUF4398 domain-containing protein [Woeseiaceae bacterium]|nr:DUF4398 domain-containing protein [Woeseiaceae bacterium]MDX2608478.1 DUF4398 domain-containing protein [Woeseiaceae bacterium]
MTLFLRSTVLAAMLVVAGCTASAPVQEMSDARQAITAAKEAGAAEYAADELDAAVEFLSSAEIYLNNNSFHFARRDAIAAKSKALDALKLSETDQE